jgi:two-component system sensor histidine kinase SenX3
VAAVVVAVVLVVRRREVGELRELAARAGPVAAPGAEVAATDLVGLALDRATDRAESADDARELLRRALDAIPEAVIVTDDEGRVRFRNGPARVYERARHGEALVEAALHELVADALEGHSGERSLELFGPPRRTLVASARPLPGRGARPGVLALVGDVTQRRRLEETRRDFVANISHELKTPVGAISLLAETLVAEEDPAVAARLAERIVGEADRVNRSIEDLIVLSRIESEGAPRPELVEAADVLVEAATRIAPAAEQRGLSIEIEVTGEQLQVLGDRRQLVSAVSNLLDNAVKYSEPGGDVLLRAQRSDDVVELAVEDSGIGIPAKDLDRIFERFYRVDHARSRRTGGTGLGLAIVRHVAQNHDGEVAVESRLGEGSVFALRLPGVGPDVAGTMAPTTELHDAAR